MNKIKCNKNNYEMKTNIKKIIVHESLIIMGIY